MAEKNNLPRHIAHGASHPAHAVGQLHPGRVHKDLVGGALKEAQQREGGGGIGGDGVLTQKTLEAGTEPAASMFTPWRC